MDRLYDMFRNVSLCGGSPIQPPCPFISVFGALAIYSGIVGITVLNGAKYADETEIPIYGIFHGRIVHGRLVATPQERGF